MKRAFKFIKTYIFRGLLAIIPLALSIFVLRLLYVGIDQRVMGWLHKLIGFKIPGLGILLVAIVLFLVGWLASRMVGRQMFHWLERIMSRIPLINTTYHIGKQLSDTLSLPEKLVFRKVVLVDYLKPGIWTIGFVTGSVIDKKNNNEKLLKVFVPTPPNPTSGTMVIVKESETRDPGWTVEEAMKAVISGGIIGPSEIR